MNARATIPLILALALSACGQSEEPTTGSTPAATTEATTTQQAGHPTVAVPTPSPAPAAAPTAPASPGAVGAARPPTDLGGIGRALGAAIEASQNAEGDTDCEKAYNGIVAMASAMQKATGRDPNSRHRPDRGNFLRGCNELPAQLQHCMVISYGMQHQQECQAARSQLTPAMQERVRNIMRGGQAGNGQPGPGNGPPPPGAAPVPSAAPSAP